MNYTRIVVPDVVVLPLSEGDQLTVKAQLSSGEERRMIRRGVSYGADGARTFDPVEAGVAKIVAYLLDWTVRGPDGKIVPIRDQAPAIVEAALDMLDSDSYTEILRAVEAHETKQAEARAAKKKTPLGVLTSSGT
jgi:hypothetical protein